MRIILLCTALLLSGCDFPTFTAAENAAITAACTAHHGYVSNVTTDNSSRVTSITCHAGRQ